MTISKILSAVSRQTNIPEEFILSHSRRAIYAYPRFLVCWFGYHKANLTLEEIAEFLGRDHTSIIHGRDRIDVLLQHKEKVVADVSAVTLALKEPVVRKLRSYTPSRPYPSNMDEVVATAVELFQLSGMSERKLTIRAGVNRSFMYGLKLGYSPCVGNLEAALNVLGYKLAIVPIESDQEAAA